MTEQVNIIVIYVPWFWYVIAIILNKGCQISHGSVCDGCQGFDQSQSVTPSYKLVMCYHCCYGIWKYVLRWNTLDTAEM